MEKYYAAELPKTERIGKLVADLFAKMPEIESARAILITESYRKTEGKPMVLRRALAFSHILKNLPITIRPGELVVGSTTLAPRGCQTYPEFSWEWLQAEFDTVETREADPFYIAETTKKELREANAYWKGKTSSELADAYMTPETLAMANEKDAVLAVLCEQPVGASEEAVVPTEEYVDVEVERVVGSKTVKEMTQVKVEGYAQKGTDATVVSDDTVNMNFHVQEIGQKSMNVLNDVTTYITETQKSPIEYFGNSVREKVTQLLPDVNPDTLQLEDAVDGWVSDYDYRHGDLLVDITFPEQFAADDKLVAVVGTYGTNDKIHAWTALQARPINSTARLTITQNILTRMEEGDINLIFLLKQEKENSVEQ